MKFYVKVFFLKAFILERVVFATIFLRDYLLQYDLKLQAQDSIPVACQKQLKTSVFKVVSLYICKRCLQN